MISNAVSQVEWKITITVSRMRSPADVPILEGGGGGGDFYESDQMSDATSSNGNEERNWATPTTTTTAGSAIDRWRRQQLGTVVRGGRHGNAADDDDVGFDQLAMTHLHFGAWVPRSRGGDGGAGGGGHRPAVGTTVSGEPSAATLADLTPTSTFSGCLAPLDSPGSDGDSTTTAATVSTVSTISTAITLDHRLQLYRYDLYFAYDRGDAVGTAAVWTRWAVDRLEAAPFNLRCCYAERDFDERRRRTSTTSTTTTTSAQNVLRSVLLSRRVVVALTPGFVESTAWRELEEAIAPAPHLRRPTPESCVVGGGGGGRLSVESATFRRAAHGPSNRMRTPMSVILLADGCQNVPELLRLQTDEVLDARTDRFGDAPLRSLHAGDDIDLLLIAAIFHSGFF